MPSATCPYVGTPASIWERIRDDIVLTLQSVTTGNGWRQSLTVEPFRQRGQSAPSHGLCIVHVDDPVAAAEEDQDQRSNAWDVDYAIQFFCVQSEAGTTDADELVLNMAGDIVSALCQSTTEQRGGLATYTRPMQIARFEAEDGEFLGAIVVVRVRAEHVFGDPTRGAYE